MTQIRCVMFDCINVLNPFDTVAFFSFIRKHSGNSLSPENIFSGPGLELLKKYDLGLLSDADFFRGVRDLFWLNVSQELFFATLVSIMKLDMKMYAIKDRLVKRGVATAIVSNMNPANYAYLKKHFPRSLEGFDYKMISCEEGIAKPNPEAWIRPLDFLGFKAEECIFIDDCYENIEAACRLGMKGWYYNSTDSSFCTSGKMEEERNKFRNFLRLIDSRGLLYDKNKARV